MLADDFGDEGLADSHSALGRKAPVEDICNDPAGSRFGHERLEADDFPPDPCRFGPGADNRAHRRIDPAIRACVAVQSEAGKADQVQG